MIRPWNSKPDFLCHFKWAFLNLKPQTLGEKNSAIWNGRVCKKNAFFLVNGYLTFPLIWWFQSIWTLSIGFSQVVQINNFEKPADLVVAIITIPLKTIPVGCIYFTSCGFRRMWLSNMVVSFQNYSNCGYATWQHLDNIRMLVGGFNPSQTYESKWNHLPQGSG